MALSLDEIVWSEPIVPRAEDPAWEAEIKRRGGRVGEVDRRVAPLPWLRETCQGVTAGQYSAISDRLFNIAAMVTSQENACRYCYGANRAYMKILGYPEAFIRRIEQDVQLAELDAKERALVAFARSLARSRPRPALAERDALVSLGYSRAAAHEIALWIALGCFYNRIGVLMAAPPELEFERMANGFVGRLIGLAGPLMRALSARRRRASGAASLDAATLAQGPFGPVLVPLAGLPGARVMKTALEGAFASPLISRAAKALMFAIVARTLDCRPCESGARTLLQEEGFQASEIDEALAMLSSKRLSPAEARLLPWVRSTVHYQTGPIQQQTRALAAAIGPAAALEAIGVAALANATVRVAMLVE
jgi:alkylhydroperoxidase family enzyme